MNDLTSDSTPLPEVHTSHVADLSNDEEEEDDISSQKSQNNATNIRTDPRVVHLRDCSKIHIGPFYSCTDPASVRTPPPGAKSPVNSFCEQIQLPPENQMKALLRSERLVELSDLDGVSVHIGHTWRELGRKMCYSPGELDNVDADHARLVDKAYALLTLWRDRESSHATVSHLTKLLMTVKIYEAVRTLGP